MNAIFEVASRRRTPKYQQIVNSVTKAIKDGRLKTGDRISSINEVSSDCNISRDTIQRAYNLLEKENIIEAVKGKGFYINRTDIMARLRVLLVFNRISNYKKMIYDSFVNTMGNEGTVDLRIHQEDVNILGQIINTHTADYDYYVVMPHFYEHTAEACRIMLQLPNEKLMVLDKDIRFPGLDCSGVFQDFENDIRDALAEGIDALSKYNKLIYVHPVLTPHPCEIITGFKRFCEDYHFQYDIVNEINESHPLRKGEAYIVIEESDLANLIKNCDAQQLLTGKDVGIISYNDTSIKRMLLGGISILSTDHYQMGETAARMILNNSHGKIRIPFKLILRNSL